MTRPCAIFASLIVLCGLSATGCTHFGRRMSGSGFAVDSAPGKSEHPSFDNRSGGDGIGGIRQAGGGGPPATPNPPNGFPKAETLPPPAEMWHPGLPQLPAPGDFGFPAGDPHTRNAPTVGGAMLNLQPGETATDRVVGLAKELGLLSAQLDLQQSRIRELEAAAATREQALSIATRELEALRSDAADVAKARAETAMAYSELTAVKEKLRQVQVEDVETLKKIIATLDRLFPPPRREP